MAIPRLLAHATTCTLWLLSWFFKKVDNLQKEVKLIWKNDTGKKKIAQKRQIQKDLNFNYQTERACSIQKGI